jgi:acyl-coenzyme A thioesterase PaaI-like protein
LTADVDALRAVLARIPYARFLGVQVELFGDEMTAILPFSDHLIGNPTLPAIHGGVLGAFMEMTALAQLSVAQYAKEGPPTRQPRIVDVTVQYLRSGRPQTTYARARLNRAGRRIASVYVEAWQAERAAPIASLQGHFLISPKEA